MRSIVIGLVFVLASIPAAYAQQLQAPSLAPTYEMKVSQPEASPAHGPMNLAPAALDRPAPADRAPVAVEVRAAENEAAVTRAAAPMTARSVLAIIGGVVVVVALIALFS